jgi:predicted alpha/beta hydrolase
VEWFGEDASDPARPLVVFLPAMGVNTSFYRETFEAWAACGASVAAIEARGMKQSTNCDVRGKGFGYAEVLDIDLATIVPRLVREAGPRPVYLAGHSLGGQFALLYASVAKHAVDGVILVGGGSNHFATLPSRGARVKRYVGFRFIRVLLALLGYFPGHKIGFGGRQPRRLMADWTHEGLTGRYPKIGELHDYEARLRQARFPVLMISFESDGLVPASSADALARKLVHADVSRSELKLAGLPGRRSVHFGWAKEPQPVLAAIMSWIRSREGASRATRQGVS